MIAIHPQHCRHRTLSCEVQAGHRLGAEEDQLPEAMSLDVEHAIAGKVSAAAASTADAKSAAAVRRWQLCQRARGIDMAQRERRARGADSALGIRFDPPAARSLKRYDTAWQQSKAAVLRPAHAASTRSATVPRHSVPQQLLQP